jgi:hypothetical protein
MQDKRLTHRLTEYWNQLRGDGALPKWEDFDPVSFGDIWHQCCGWKVDTEDATSIVYTYEYVGDSVMKMAGKNLMGEKFISLQQAAAAGIIKRSISESLAGELLTKHFNNFPAARILKKIDRVVKRPALVIEEGRTDDDLGKNVRFRSCLLPFGNETGKVSHMVLGLSWKVY